MPRLVLLAAALAMAVLVTPAVADTAAWTAPDLATIRPGVQVESAVGQCTSNFVFTSPDGARVYLGVAAHCVDGLAIGTQVRVRRTDGQRSTATLAYDSFRAQREAGDTSHRFIPDNDFALVQLADADRARVSPSMLHFGGPVALADRATIDTGEKVISYGASGMRVVTSGPTSWKEGYVIGRGEWGSSIWTATPGIFGDSGSGVMTGDGRAAGVLITISVATTNGYANLDRALQYAREKGGVDVRLATAPLLDDGVLPPVR